MFDFRSMRCHRMMSGELPAEHCCTSFLKSLDGVINVFDSMNEFLQQPSMAGIQAQRFAIDDPEERWIEMIELIIEEERTSTDVRLLRLVQRRIRVHIESFAWNSASNIKRIFQDLPQGFRTIDTIREFTGHINQSKQSMPADRQRIFLDNHFRVSDLKASKVGQRRNQRTVPLVNWNSWKLNVDLIVVDFCDSSFLSPYKFADRFNVLLMSIGSLLFIGIGSIKVRSIHHGNGSTMWSIHFSMSVARRKDRETSRRTNNVQARVLRFFDCVRCLI